MGYLSKGKYDGRDEDGKATGDFTASDSVATLAYGRRAGKKGSIGGSIKMIQSKIESFSATGFALDFSGSLKMNQKMRLAGGIYNLGPSMKFVSESFALPSTLSAGISYNLLSGLTVTADSNYGIEDQKLTLSFGGEIGFAGIATARIGYMPNFFQNKAGNKKPENIDQIAGLGMGMGSNYFLKQASITPSSPWANSALPTTSI